MKEEIIRIARENCVDIVKFASVERFDENNPIFKIYPKVGTIIGLAFRILRGVYRGIEEGTTYYQYSTMGVENMEETIMPMAMLNIANYIEAQGFSALPQRKHQSIMAEKNSTNPEVDYETIYRNRPQEIQLDFLDTAIKCGIGEKGLHNALLTDAFGPMVRYCFILTDAKLEADEIVSSHLCDKCGKCINGCPGKAIDENGNVDSWQCAVYYNGANGMKNPFMPLDAYSDMENRISIIAGEAMVTPNMAKNILDETVFYPPIMHQYRSSICGRKCDIECYIHLEEKGVLTEKYKSPFRKREEWKFNLEDFKS